MACAACGQAARKYGFRLAYDPEEERRGHPLFMRDWGRNAARVHPDRTVFETQMGDIKNTLAFVGASLRPLGRLGACG